MPYNIKGEASVQTGFGLPQHTTVSRTAYTPPTEGYQVYDTDLDQVFFWDGAAWNALAAGGGGGDYATADLTANAIRTHTWNAFDQIENFTTGQVTKNWDDTTGNTALVDFQTIRANLEYYNNTAGTSQEGLFEMDDASFDVEITDFNADEGTLLVQRQNRLYLEAEERASGDQLRAGVYNDGNELYFNFHDNNGGATNNWDLRINDDAGTVGQILTSQGVGSAPTWAAPGAGSNMYGIDGTTGAGRAIALTDTLAFDNNTLFIDGTNNRVGIGTATPTTDLHVDGTVRIVDGTEAAGYILTSDANGVASWQTVPTISAPNYVNNDLVGIGLRNHAMGVHFIKENYTTGRKFLNFDTGAGQSFFLEMSYEDFEYRNYNTQGANNLESNFKINPFDIRGTVSDNTTSNNCTIFTQQNRIRLSSSNGATGDLTGFNIRNDGTNLYYDFEATNNFDIRLKNNAGTSGQQITSQGIGISPIWGAASDERIKRDIEDVPSAVDLLSDIEIKSFKFRDEDKTSYGVIAQQVKQHLPDLIDDSQKSTDIDGNQIDIHTVDYQSLFALSIQAIKELKAEVETLKSRLDA